MTYIKRVFVRRGHPRHIILAYVSLMWTIYFFWFHNWVWGVAAILVGAVLGRVSTLSVREESLAQTALGRLMLLHLHPLNLTLQCAGITFLLYGVWIHSGTYIITAISLIMIGHLWGWNKVSEAF